MPHCFAAMLSIIILSVIIQSAVVLNVVAPYFKHSY
jgi:hypothetical protein